MIVLREKSFGRIKYPDDWDEDDFDYLDKIDEEKDKKIVKDSIISAGIASLPSVAGMVINKKFKPRIKSGLALGGANFILSNMFNNSEETKKKYRKIKDKKDRIKFQRETKLNPGIIETIKNNSILLV